MAPQEADNESKVFEDPVWVQMSGGWIHANNVLFYFALSPFFDPLSTNNTVFVQSQGIPEREMRFLATREKFETELQRHKGIQYVVDVDPLQRNVIVDGPNGPERSQTWVIRKQNRHDLSASSVPEILDYYYIIDLKIFQAPRLNNILAYRMMNSLTTIDKLVQIASGLPQFSPAFGYSYYTENQKSASNGRNEESQLDIANASLSEEATAANPDSAGASARTDELQADEKTTRRALALTLEYGETFYDDEPLVGEPGNFRYSRPKNAVQSLRIPEGATNIRTVPPSKAGTPAPSQVIKAPSTVASPAPDTPMREQTQTAKPKPKRKKSIAANGPT